MLWPLRRCALRPPTTWSWSPEGVGRAGARSGGMQVDASLSPSDDDHLDPLHQRVRANRAKPFGRRWGKSRNREKHDGQKATRRGVVSGYWRLAPASGGNSACLADSVRDWVSVTEFFQGPTPAETPDSEPVSNSVKDSKSFSESGLALKRANPSCCAFARPHHNPGMVAASVRNPRSCPCYNYRALGRYVYRMVWRNETYDHAGSERHPE